MRSSADRCFEEGGREMSENVNARAERLFMLINYIVLFE